MRRILVNKLLAVYGLPFAFSNTCELYAVKNQRESTCYAGNHSVSAGSEVIRAVVPTKANGGVTICKKCFEKILEEHFFVKTLNNGQTIESDNTGRHTVAVVTDNIADIVYLKLYGFGLFHGRFNGKLTAENLLAKTSVNATETMRNIKPFYDSETATVYVNGKIAKSYEDARNIAKMKIQEELQ
jgi:hypothetical protein